MLHRSLLLRRGERIEADDVSFEVEPGALKASEDAAGYDPHAGDNERIYIVSKTLEEIDDETFVKTWQRLGARPTKVAQALGQSRGAVYRRMEKLGIPTTAEQEGRDEE